mmetsp:Transcript_490/g.1870  ORF Transcript_490/g.1870 Transcript_490/m.1870 type:complete len:450 (+) Transcript_490:123-1472(+)
MGRAGQAGQSLKTSRIREAGKGEGPRRSGVPGGQPRAASVLERLAKHDVALDNLEGLRGIRGPCVEVGTLEESRGLIEPGVRDEVGCHGLDQAGPAEAAGAIEILELVPDVVLRDELPSQRSRGGVAGNAAEHRGLVLLVDGGRHGVVERHLDHGRLRGRCQSAEQQVLAVGLRLRLVGGPDLLPAVVAAVGDVGGRHGAEVVRVDVLDSGAPQVVAALHHSGEPERGSGADDGSVAYGGVNRGGRAPASEDRGRLGRGVGWEHDVLGADADGGVAPHASDGCHHGRHDVGGVVVELAHAGDRGRVGGVAVAAWRGLRVDVCADARDVREGRAPDGVLRLGAQGLHVVERRGEGRRGGRLHRGAERGAVGVGRVGLRLGHGEDVVEEPRAVLSSEDGFAVGRGRGVDRSTDVGPHAGGVRGAVVAVRVGVGLDEALHESVMGEAGVGGV